MTKYDSLQLGQNYFEKWMLHEFKKKYQLYSQHAIDENQEIEWLSVMQHYGAPTRLLDFSFSMYVATYFALEFNHNTSSSIWAVNWQKLRDNLKETYALPYSKGKVLKDEVNQVHRALANTHIGKTQLAKDSIQSSVIPIEPKLFNERIARQQGTFLFPTNGNETFEFNLRTAFNAQEEGYENIRFEDLVSMSHKLTHTANIDVIVIDIPSELTEHILESLYTMNINAEILFPGLDGLARSLLHTQIRVC
ncbi:hypothetical protein GCM10011318_15160 [Phaeocystidibacter marisrubri]|nr:hypothetical protein GCM10011318_15160 [Phaeocystidibacter marisrubri]